MNKEKRRVLVIGDKIRIPLPGRIFTKTKKTSKPADDDLRAGVNKDSHKTSRYTAGASVGAGKAGRNTAGYTDKAGATGYTKAGIGTAGYTAKAKTGPTGYTAGGYADKAGAGIGKDTQKTERKSTGAVKAVADNLRQKASPLVQRKVKLGSYNVPIVFFLAAFLAFLPIGIAFGQDTEPTGRNLTGPPSGVELYNVNFYSGSPNDETPTPIPIPEYPDGAKIQNGNFWLSFDWRLADDNGWVEYGDYFDIVLDLGLSSIGAEVSQQSGTFAPIIYSESATAAGTINWVGAKDYKSQKQIVIRLAFDSSGFETLTGDGTPEGRVKGSGVWGFQYKAGIDSAGPGVVNWQISVGADGIPMGTTPVDPEPPGDVKPGGNTRYNPYDETEAGYSKTGTRLTPESAPLADTIFFWNIFINGHKHENAADWASCPYGCPSLPVDPATGELAPTFTIVDEGSNISPTWLRNVVESGGNLAAAPDDGLAVRRGGGIYGSDMEQTDGPAYLKLFYVDSEHIWTDRIDYDSSNYRTPANDKAPGHQASEGHPVGAYDPYYTTWAMREGQTSALMCAPNYGSDGEKYDDYLTPVPSKDIRSITLTPNGFEIEMVTEAVLGKTLAIAFMTTPAADAQGAFNNEVKNLVSIRGLNNGPVASATSRVLTGGAVSGQKPISDNKGSFIINAYDYNTVDPIEAVVFDIVASSDDQDLQDNVNERITMKKEVSDPPDVLQTGADGKLVLSLPPLPWKASLKLSVTETAPSGFIGVMGFTVTLEPENGSVIGIEAESGDKAFIKPQLDQYGIEVWNRSSSKDTSFYDVALRNWVKKIDREVGGVKHNLFYSDDPHTETVSVRDGDVILYRIDVYNQCFNRLYITEIVDYLPPGLVFDPLATIAHAEAGNEAYNNNMWRVGNGTDEPEDMLIYKGPPIRLEPWDGSSNGYPEHRLALVLTVDLPENFDESTLLTNIAEISQITNEAGEIVADGDSVLDRDRDNDGAVPGIDYGDNPPAGKAVDNEIEQKRKDIDGYEDLSQDEDDQDFAAVAITKAVSCEVNKDTIRRTSAAFDGSLFDAKVDEHLINNVGKETYRYDVDFRSTSSMPADEFVVDDPLENVNYDQVRLVGLWTPAVWGDSDGRMNVWYKTSKKTNASGISAEPPSPPVTEGNINNHTFPTLVFSEKNQPEGWKLWTTIVQDPTKFAANGVIDRVKLNIDSLQLDEDDYITALRFEYGAVEVGFTSRNYSGVSQNGEHRGANGEIQLPADDLARIESLSTTETGELKPSAEPAAAAAQAEEPKKNFFAQLFGATFGAESQGTDTAAAAVSTDAAQGGALQAASAFDRQEAFEVQASPADTVNIDWTPDPLDHYYSAGAVAAQNLAPASYLVETIRPMEAENIVSSAVAQIAVGGRWDVDVDAVITRQLVGLPANGFGSSSYTLESTYQDMVSNQETGGFAARTYDDMDLVFWIGMAASALTGAAFVFLVWRIYNRRKVAAARAGRAGRVGRDERDGSSKPFSARDTKREVSAARMRRTKRAGRKRTK